MSGLALLLLLLGLAWLKWGLDPWLRRKLEQQVATRTHGQYRLRVTGLRTELLARSLTASERERRAMLYGAAVVCRRWSAAAMAMLPSIVVRSSEELAAHASAVDRGTLDGARVHSLTVDCFDMAADDAARLHALAIAMPNLYFLRLACAATIHECAPRWPGRHMVVAEFECSASREHTEWPDSNVFEILDASPDICHFSALKCVDIHNDGSVSLGANSACAPGRFGSARKATSTSSTSPRVCWAITRIRSCLASKRCACLLAIWTTLGRSLSATKASAVAFNSRRFDT